jgi:hypothetical protein
MTITVDDFWNEVSDAIEAGFGPDDIGKLLDDYRGLWPLIEKEIERDPARRALFDRALALRDSDKDEIRLHGLTLAETLDMPGGR